jgi:protein ImuB
VPPCLRDEPNSTEIAQLLDRLGNRFGFDRLARLAPRASHVPERAVARLSVAKEVSSPPWPVARPRPLRLSERPEPVEAMALLPDHPPSLFRRGAALHRIARAEGPERLLLEWWRARPHADADALAVPARDYFRVEDTEGRRYWLYREAPPQGAPRWFLHGQFG